MALVVNLSVGRLISRNEKLTTAKINAVVKSIVIDVTGSVGNSDILAGAVTYDKASMGPWFYATGVATFDGNQTYTATFTPAITAYVDGTVLAFKAAAANGKNVLLNAGAGALAILKHGGSKQLDPGDLVANGIAVVRYNQTLVAGGCFELLSLPGRPVEYQVMQGASAYMPGIHGYVPEPKQGQNGYYLRGDGTWVDVVTQVTNTFNNQNTYTAIFNQINFI